MLFLDWIGTQTQEMSIVLHSCNLACTRQLSNPNTEFSARSLGATGAWLTLLSLRLALLLKIQERSVKAVQMQEQAVRLSSCCIYWSSIKGNAEVKLGVESAQLGHLVC
jgi:hypothetical protein